MWPMVEGMVRSVRSCSPIEIKQRMRRWWRWRTKYAAKTKLNV